MAGVLTHPGRLSGSFPVNLKRIVCEIDQFFFSQAWFAIPQLVLHALWQDVWHSPQPPFFALFAISRVFNV